MIVGILGILIGLGILGAGIYYLKTDKEENARRIYGTVFAVGAVIAIVSVIILISSL